MFISIYTMTDRVSYRNLLVEAYEFFQSDMMNKLVTLNPKTHFQTITNQQKVKNINYGDVRLNNIRKYLDLFPGYVRSEMQKKFHESFLQVNIWLLCSSFYHSLLILTLFLFYRQWLYIFTRTIPRYLTVLTFYNHCIELTPFFFLFTGGHGQVIFECNLFSFFSNIFTNSFYFLLQI